MPYNTPEIMAMMAKSEKVPPVSAHVEIKAELEAWIKANIVPFLPKHSPTYALHFNKPSAEDEHKVIIELLLITFMRALHSRLIESISASMSIAVIAKLCEKLKSGNCGEQTYYAAVKLVAHPYIAKVEVVTDEVNDHMYLLLQVKAPAAKYWIYDPWFKADRLMELDEHTHELSKSFPKEARLIYEEVPPKAAKLYQEKVDGLVIEGDLIEEQLPRFLEGAVLSFRASFSPVAEIAVDPVKKGFTPDQLGRLYENREGKTYLACPKKDHATIKTEVMGRVASAFAKAPIDPGLASIIYGNTYRFQREKVSAKAIEAAR